MATLTAYQVQAKRRISKALRLRARSDNKVRHLAARLVAAVADAATAATHLGTINTLYGTNYTVRTTLVGAVDAAGVSASLAAADAGSAAGSPEQLYASVANANGGAALAADADLD